MTPDKTPENSAQRAALATQLSQELLQLRDSLVKLSLCLKDWQFELSQHDGAAQQLTNQTLEKFKIQRGPTAATDTSTRSPASGGH